MPKLTRRHFTASALAAGLPAIAGSLPSRAWARAARQSAGPSVTSGVASGDVAGNSAVIWARADRDSRMLVEWATAESFRDAHHFTGPAAIRASDFTAKAVLDGLPPGQTIFYRVRFEDLARPGTIGEPVVGRLRTPALEPDRMRLVWGGDVCGQGWGIDPARGGLATFASMREADPDLFLHSGDHIYADNPIVEEVKLEDGSTWKNIVTPEKSKVAETLDEFRGNYRYNLMDEHVRGFYAAVPMLAQWDDHETANNWYPGELLSDPRFTEKSASLLSARARRAFFEYTPTRIQPDDSERIYRTSRWGSLAEVFLLDQRSYRGPNSANRQERLGAESAFLGPRQLTWLKRRLVASPATWKIIASDMPLGLSLGDGPNQFEGVANGDGGPPLGRELEIADLLGFLKEKGIRNVVWLTADVHYAAAHHYDPERARFRNFDPFWEFIAGPLHAGTFGPGILDDTFGPRAEFVAIPPGMKQNRPPSEGLQFFGQVEARKDVLRVSLHGRDGSEKFAKELTPA